jgi:sugar phosphate permease
MSEANLTRKIPSIWRMFRGTSGLVFLLLSLMVFIEYIDRVNLSVAGPLIKKEMGLSNIQLGLAFSAFGYCYAATQLLGGFLGDRIGARLSLTILALIWAFGTFATGVAGGLGMLIAARFLVGLGEAGSLPTAARVITNWVPKVRRGFAQGFIHAAARMAATITPLLMVALISFGGWRVAFYVLGGVSFVWLCGWFFYARDNPAAHPGITQAELDTLEPYQANVGGAAEVPWARLIRRMLPATLVFFAHAWTLWLYLTWLPSLFRETYHMNIVHSAMFTSLAFFGGMLGDICGGLLTDGIFARTGNLTLARRNVVILAFSGALICLVVVMVWHDQNVIAAALALALFSLEMAEAPIWSVPSDVAPRFTVSGAPWPFCFSFELSVSSTRA